MIGLSKITQSTSNAAIIIKEKPRSKINESVARISRSATLDGGAVIEHLGYSVGDRTLEIYAQLNKDQADNIWAFYKNNTFVNISCIDGFFYGVIESMEIPNGKMKMKIFIQE